MGFFMGIGAFGYIVGAIIGTAVCAVFIYYIILKIRFMRAATKALNKYVDRRY